MAESEPLIVGFLCNWCAYAGADTAGTARLRYPVNVRVVRVMCSGRVDPMFVLKAFREGADGVLIAGCHPGECHYSDGNHNAMRRLPLLRQLLAQFNIEPERVRLEWLSADEGARWARIVAEMTERIRVLGPLEWRNVIPAEIEREVDVEARFIAPLVPPHPLGATNGAPTGRSSGREHL